MSYITVMNKTHTAPTSSIGWRIGRLSRVAHVYFKHRFGELGLGHAQGITLHHICRHDGMDQLELLEKLKESMNFTREKLIRFLAFVPWMKVMWNFV